MYIMIMLPTPILWIYILWKEVIIYVKVRYINQFFFVILIRMWLYCESLIISVCKSLKVKSSKTENFLRTTFKLFYIRSEKISFHSWCNDWISFVNLNQIYFWVNQIIPCKIYFAISLISLILKYNLFSLFCRISNYKG